MTSVLIVSRDRHYRESMAKLTAEQPGIDAVEVAASLDDAKSACRDAPPEVLVLALPEGQLDDQWSSDAPGGRPPWWPRKVVAITFAPSSALVRKVSRAGDVVLDSASNPFRVIKTISALATGRPEVRA